MAADVIDLLRERGFVERISDAEGLRAALGVPGGAVYCGFDPTAPSLHAGHLLSIMMLRHLQAAGLRPIVLLGGATALVGDPSGRAQDRPLLGPDEVRSNLEALRPQFGRFLDLGPRGGQLVDNADWIRRLGCLDFLRDVGRHFRVGRLLEHGTYRERMQGDGLSFVEFSYALLQAYDFLHLHRTEGCVLQVGGSDQWFNILQGIELIRRAAGGRAFGLVAPLLTTAGGQKMGKTAGGAVWLDAGRTSPFLYFQHWLGTADEDVGRFLGLFTELEMPEVRRLAGRSGADRREAKAVLAFEAARLAHGEDAAQEAREASRSLFGGRRDPEASAPACAVTAAEAAAGLPAADLLVRAGFAPSRAAARRLIAQGGMRLGGERVEDPAARLDGKQLRDGALLWAGRKRVCRLCVDLGPAGEG